MRFHIYRADIFISRLQDFFLRQLAEISIYSTDKLALIIIAVFVFTNIAVFEGAEDILNNDVLCFNDDNFTHILSVGTGDSGQRVYATRNLDNIIVLKQYQIPFINPGIDIVRNSNEAYVNAIDVFQLIISAGTVHRQVGQDACQARQVFYHFYISIAIHIVNAGILHVYNILTISRGRIGYNSYIFTAFGFLIFGNDIVNKRLLNFFVNAANIVILEPLHRRSESTHIGCCWGSDNMYLIHRH